MKSLIFLATASLSLIHLAFAAPPFPESVPGTPQSIIKAAETTLSWLDANKPALFAYRTLNTPEELWGFGFFSTELRYATQPLAQRKFYAIPPPQPGAPRAWLDSSFADFLPGGTRYELVFIRQVAKDDTLKGIANFLWDWNEGRADLKVWYAKFEQMATVWKVKGA